MTCREVQTTLRRSDEQIQSQAIRRAVNPHLKRVHAALNGCADPDRLWRYLWEPRVGSPVLSIYLTTDPSKSINL